MASLFGLAVAGCAAVLTLTGGKGMVLDEERGRTGKSSGEGRDRAPVGASSGGSGPATSRAAAVGDEPGRRRSGMGGLGEDGRARARAQLGRRRGVGGGYPAAAMWKSGVAAVKP